MSARSLKVEHSGDIRRLDLSLFKSYAKFVKLVREIFNISELSGIQMSYEDEEGDRINIRSEMDMIEARRYASLVPSFKLHVQQTAEQPLEQPLSLGVYPPIAPEDLDLTASFADLMTESMQHKVEEKEEEEKEKEAKREVAGTSYEDKSTVILPTAPVRRSSEDEGEGGASKVQKKSAPMPSSSQSSLLASGAEAHFHQTLDELAQAQTRQGKEGESVLESAETQIKRLFEALVSWMESLRLDQKMKAVVAEFEPTFAKLEERVLSPLNEFGQRTSREIQSEMSHLSKEVNSFSHKLSSRLQDLSSSPPSSSSSPPSPAPPSSPAPHNALEDLLHLEAMGFSDRRRNLELLASHKGDLNAVVDALLI